MRHMISSVLNFLTDRKQNCAAISAEAASQLERHNTVLRDMVDLVASERDQTQRELHMERMRIDDLLRRIDAIRKDAQVQYGRLQECTVRVITGNALLCEHIRQLQESLRQSEEARAQLITGEAAL